MRIRDIAFPEGAGLAPMAGVADAAMRAICFEHGAAWAVSEMLSAKGWLYSAGKNRNALELLQRLPGEGITGLQLFGSDPEYVSEAAEQLQDLGFSFIDLNFGCPAPKITGNGEGSAMLLVPDRIESVVRRTVQRIELPVTVKIRAGWDDEHVNAVEVAKICEGSGAAAITVHGRTRAQQYGGRADRSIIRDVKNAVNIPVIGNGDVTSGEEAKRMLEETGCDAVMIGRAARGDPWIFEEVLSAIRCEEYTAPDLRERRETLLEHMRLVYELHGAKRGMLEMRKHIAWYVNRMPGASRFRERINTIQDPEMLLGEVCAFMQ